MAGMFWYFGDRDLKTTSGLDGFPRNFLEIGEHILSAAPIPYIPGAPFLMAATLALLSILAFISITNKADRDARYTPKAEPKSEAEELGQPPITTAP